MAEPRPPISLIWLISSIRCELTDLRGQLMSARARDGVERLFDLLDELDKHDGTKKCEDSQ